VNGLEGCGTLPSAVARERRYSPRLSTGGIEWVVCGPCADRKRAVEEAKARGEPVGAQLAICSEPSCRKLFMAPRADVKFCSATCRSRHWREQRGAAKVNNVGR
jgi:hypothetical protein